MGKREGEEEKGRSETKPFSKSNHAVWGWKAPVKASVSGVSLLQLSLFRFHLSRFPQKRLILRLGSHLTLTAH